MWALLSTRVRTWVLLAAALPLTRRVTHLVATRLERRSPDATVTVAAQRVDNAVTSFSQRLARRRHRKASA